MSSSSISLQLNKKSSKPRIALPAALLASAEDHIRPASPEAVSLSGISLDQVHRVQSATQSTPPSAIVPLHLAEDTLRFKGEAMDFAKEVAALPAAMETSAERYTALPVDQFGDAMLRGMGWKPGDPVGKSRARVVEAVEIKKRPGLLGLGAQLSQDAQGISTLKNRKKQLEKEKAKFQEEEDGKRYERKRSSERRERRKSPYRSDEDRRRSHRDRSRSYDSDEERRKSKKRRDSRDDHYHSSSRKYDDHHSKRKYDDRDPHSKYRR